MIKIPKNKKKNDKVPIYEKFYYKDLLFLLDLWNGTVFEYLKKKSHGTSNRPEVKLTR